MKKIVCFLLIFIMSVNINQHVYAKSKMSTEHLFYKIKQYEQFDNAVKKFETANKVKIAIPKKFPFKITHKFGKLEGDSYLDLCYYNEKTKEQLQTIIINDKQSLDQIPTDLIFKVNETKVVFRQRNVGSKVKFHKGNLTYIIFVSNKTKNFNKNDVINIVKSIK